MPPYGLLICKRAEVEFAHLITLSMSLCHTHIASKMEKTKSECPSAERIISDFALVCFLCMTGTLNTDRLQCRRVRNNLYAKRKIETFDTFDVRDEHTLYTQKLHVHRALQGFFMFGLWGTRRKNMQK